MGKVNRTGIASGDLFDSKLNVRQLLFRMVQAEAPAPESSLADPAKYDEIFRNMTQGVVDTQKRLARERKLAGIQGSALEKHPQARRVIMIRNDRRFQSWGLYKCFVERYRSLAEDNPPAAAEAAELALTVAQCLDPKEHGPERIADFLAGALSALGDSKRRLGDLDGALADFDAARENLEKGTGDPLEEAELEHLRARLLRDLGRDEEAESALRRASTLYRRIGDPRLQDGWDGSPEDESGHHPVPHRHHARRGGRQR
ncbi:MAG TPA: tetratricopeptide repeat protein [Thermoanaerobaculia bacterium]|nr:tetratricopeptide repeat protein [Thermoanaerobaculia bacterium]